MIEMGIKRIVDVSFWTDGKVDDFSPEDKYFMLYLLTNPFSKQLGIYEISIRQAAFQMGYSVDAFNVLLDRFENKYNMILFSRETSEVAILNFLIHSVIKGGKPVEDCIKKEMKLVKNEHLIDAVFSKVRGKKGLNETVVKIIDEYIKEKENDIHNDNDNDNDNERTHGESSNDSHNDSCCVGVVSEKGKKNGGSQPSKSDVDAFFEAIWSIYPVKKGKGQVSDAKRKALFKIGYEKLKVAIERYLKELQKDSSWRKPQNGSTFFNSGYVDYLDGNFEPQADIQQTQEPMDYGNPEDFFK